MRAAGWILAALCAVSAQPQTPAFDEAREHLAASLTRSLFGRNPVESKRVLDAIRKVPRHEFVPESLRSKAYDDTPLPIGHEQTISQPYIVAIMTEALDVKASDRVLEIGTGSGYQAAVLAELAEQVYTVEIVPELAEQAGAKLAELGYDNVEVRAGDGYQGWPEHAPFDGIIVTAAPGHVPQPLIDQLNPGGRLVIPVGPEFDTQELLLISKDAVGAVSRKTLELVRFVPMTGDAQER